MLSLLLAAALAQPASAPPVVVLVSRRTGLSSEAAFAAAERVQRALREAGVVVPVSPREAHQRLAASGLGTPVDCRGRKQCLASLGITLHAPVVVTVDLGEVRPDLALHVEALSADGTSLSHDSFVVSSADVERLVEKARPFAMSLRATLHRVRASVPTDVPRVEPAPGAALTPSGGSAAGAGPGPGPVGAVSGSGLPATSVLVSGGATAAAAVVTVTFGILGLSSKGAVEGTQPLPAGGRSSRLSWPEAQALREKANGQLTVSAVAAAMTLGLGITTAVLALREERR